MRKRDVYSIWALILVLIFEIFVIIAMQKGCLWYGIVSVIAIIIIILLWIEGNNKNLEFKLKSVVASNLLANAIAPRAISAFYLLFFIIHIGWLTDSSFNLFLPKAYVAWEEVVISLTCGLIGTLFLVVFFPKSGGNKGGNTHLIISGLSSPFAPKGWNSEIDDEREIAYSKLNLRPLVRILQCIADENNSNCEFLILRTNAINEDNLLNVLRLVKDDIYADFAGCNTVNDKIMQLIKEVAKREFGWEWLDQLEKKISFTNSCDYDDFNECYKELTRSIAQIDEKKYVLHFNITPGTSNIGGLMTLLAMDPQRYLYYYRQKEGLADDVRMKPIEKDYESLKLLFSSTLEKIQGNEQ